MNMMVKMADGKVIYMPSEQAAELIEAGVAEAAADQTEPEPKKAAEKKPERKKSKRATDRVEEAVAKWKREER
jgi:hypothetical protein